MLATLILIACYLRWFIDGTDNCLDTQWDMFIHLILSQQEPNSLSTTASPAIQETIHNTRMVKHHIVHMSIGLEERGS